MPKITGSTVILGYSKTVGYELVHSSGYVVFYNHDELEVLDVHRMLVDDITMEWYSPHVRERIEAQVNWVKWNFKKRYPKRKLGTSFTIRKRKQYVKYYVPKDRQTNTDR